MIKMLRLAATFAVAFFYAGAALAQNAGNVTAGAYAIGLGPGKTGYASLLCGSAQLAVGQSAAAPICRTLTGDVTIDATGVTAIGSLKVITGMIANNAVTLAKLATIANNTALCNVSGSTAAPIACSATQLTTLVNPFTVSLPGVVPAPGTATGKFLRDDGTWQAVAGSGSVTSVGTAGILTGGPITASGTLNVNATVLPQGRITLASGQPVMQSSQAGATTIYYTPSAGNLIPLYDGTNFVPTAFSQVSQTTTDTTKSPAAVAASSCYDMFGWLDGGTFRVTRGPAWTNTTTRSAGTALVSVNGIWLNNVSITNGPAASRGTYVGTICSNASLSIDYIFGALSSGGTAGVFNVWNAYNRVPVYSLTGDNSGTTEVSSTAGWRSAFNNTAIRTTFVVGLVSEPVKARYDGFVGANSGTVAGGNVGFNSTTAPMGNGTAVTSATFTVGPIFGGGPVYPILGQNYFQALHYVLNTVSVTFSSQGGAGAIQMGLTTELWQ